MWWRGLAEAAGDINLWKNAELKSVIVTIRRRNNDNNDSNSNNPFKELSTKFDAQRMNADNIHTQDTTNIQNTDRGKMGWPGDRDKQVMLIQSKMKHSARLTKKQARGDLQY